MKTPIWLLSLLIVAALQAQEPVARQVARALELRNAGDPAAVINLLNPIFQNEISSLSDPDRGVLFNLLGSSYQDLEQYEKARRCYEQAIRLLRPFSAYQSQYAATLDNMGSIESFQGRLNASRDLRERALRIYEKLGDHAGTSRTFSNLAVTADLQGDLKTAHRALARAFDEAGNATRLDDDDWAAMYSVQGSLALQDRLYGAAIESYTRMIERWVHAHGPGYFMLGTGHALRAKALATAGNLTQATSDIQQALVIFQNSIAKNSTAQWRAELIYAQILRASGQKQEALRVEQAARAALVDVGHVQCSGCTISVESLR